MTDTNPTICWNCNYSYSITNAKCPSCDAHNANVNIDAANLQERNKLLERELDSLQSALKVAQQERVSYRNKNAINEQNAIHYKALFEKAEASKSQPVPVEPEQIKMMRYDEPEGRSDYERAITEYIDSLQTALQRVREERDKCAMMNDDQSRRVYAAEEKVRRMVELMKEPTEQGAQMSNFSGNGFDAKG